MSDQNFHAHFHAPVDTVAGRDVVNNYFSGTRDERVDLGPQKWTMKHYIAGQFFTSGWLTVLTFGLFFALLAYEVLTGLRQLSNLTGHSLAVTPIGPTHSMFPPVTYAAAVLILMFGGVVRQVWDTGFVGVPRTLIGIARDINRHVFVARLAGEGSRCPICKVNLRFHNSGQGNPILRCSHNRNHCWLFDFTSVERRG
jgi:hypothetical protein